MKKLVILALVASLFTACQSDKKDNKTTDSLSQAPAPKPDTLTYVYDSVKVYSKTPVSSDKRVTDTAKAVIEYPVFQDTILNNYLEKTVVAAANSNVDAVYSNYTALANGFIKSFDTFQKDNEDRIQTWFLDTRLNVLLQEPGFICFSLQNLDYTGGAHGNQSYRYLNYDLKAHRLIKLDELFKPGTKPELVKIAEAIFRKNEGLSPTASLANGYFFTNNQFALNENFLILADGIEFLYNPYEIKPYASGKTRLMIPYAQIKALIRPNTILSTLID
jgi:hypothetical protein